MSNCGSCRNKACTCQINGDGSTTLSIGLGSTYEPIQIRPTSPAYRPVGSAYRTSLFFVAANTDIAIPFQTSELPFSASVDMWKVAFPTRLTVPIDGLYLIGGMAGRAADNSNAQVVKVWISKNGLSATPLVKRSMNTGGVGTWDISVDVTTLVRLSATDYIELYIRANTSGNTSPGATAYTAHPFMWANWMGA